MNKLIGAMGEARSVKMNGLEVKRFVPRLYILGNKS
jgi:hypothetical protein